MDITVYKKKNVELEIVFNRHQLALKIRFIVIQFDLLFISQWQIKPLDRLAGFIILIILKVKDLKSLKIVPQCVLMTTKPIYHPTAN